MARWICLGLLLSVISRELAAALLSHSFQCVGHSGAGRVTEFSLIPVLITSPGQLPETEGIVLGYLYQAYLSECAERSTAPGSIRTCGETSITPTTTKS